MIATRCQILRLNAPNSISAGAPPRPRWGAYNAATDPLAGIKGAALRQGWEQEGIEKGRGKGWGGRGRGGEEGRERKGRDGAGKGKGDRGNGRDGTGHLMGRGGKAKEKEEGAGKGGERLQPQTSIHGAATAAFDPHFVNP